MPLNPLQMNDWKIQTTLKAILILQALLWGCIGLDAAGVHVPLLRGLLAVGYLLFVPGVLILRVLRLHRLGDVRTALFAVGLSVATLMFVGLLMSTLYPLLGIERPLALVPVVITMGILIGLLAALSYWRDQHFTEYGIVRWQQVLQPPVVALCVLPFFSILAAYAMNAYQSNVLLLCLIIVMAVTAFWTSTSPSFPKPFYPLAVFVIALALLYHGSLVSPYVWGWDIQQELYNANLVLANAQWNVHAPGSVNAVLSITLLAPLLSTMSGVSVVWIFKAIYPFLFALVPLGLFVVFQKQTTDRIALLSSFFVTFLFTFFTEMPALARQEIAELFLVLLLLVFVSKDLKPATGNATLYALSAVFAASLIVSHYALAFILLAYLVLAWLLLFLFDNPAIRRLNRTDAGREPVHAEKSPRMVTLVFILLFAAFTATWYASLGSAAIADGIAPVLSLLNSTLFASFRLPVVIGVGIVAYICALALVYLIAARKAVSSSRLYEILPFALSASFFAFARSVGLSINELLQIGTLSPLHEVARFLYLLGLLLAAVGLIALVLRACRLQFHKEYVALAVASFMVLMASTAIPSLALIINTTRLYHISTLLLAPLVVIGALLVAIVPRRLGIVEGRWIDARNAFKLVAALFAVMLLFSTGFVYEITRQDPTSFFLNEQIDTARFNEREVAAAQWLSQVRPSETDARNTPPVYADAYRGLLWTSLDGNYSLNGIPDQAYKMPRDGYVYLGTFNTETGSGAQVYNARSFLNGTLIFHSGLSGVIDERNRIFSDGGATIYYHQ